MPNTENISQQRKKSELSVQQLIGGRAAYQQLLRFQSDIVGQDQRLAMAMNSIAEALVKDGIVPSEMMNHLKAQILLSHLQLDELEQLLDAID